MNIKDLVNNTGKLQYKDLCSALIERFGVKQTVKWDSVLPHAEQQSLFGGEILRLVADHSTLADQKEIRPICLMKGDKTQLLFFYVQLKDEKLPKADIERITRKFVGGAAADRYIIWFFGNKSADVLKVVISGKEGKKIRLKTLSLEAGQWFKTYDYILSEVERKFNTGGLFQQFKEPAGLWKAVWEAFDISIVNKKFYAEIKAVFDALTKEELPKCKGVLVNEQDRVQFAIRLIGRIIFCWFLKRKGIVTNDVLSTQAVQSQKNYYRDLLEILFFDVFNTPLKERNKDLPELLKNYPFLNGGLFEPQAHDYKGNWALLISNAWFENFFNNTLERYNFTVDENSASSSEIAIDPEMLGRIFENLLAEQNPETKEILSKRKETGSYYTPREIVDFMVEESLIAYLKTNDAIAIEEFIHTGSLPDSLKPNSKELLNKLSSIKVLDPACGSGAFPISMLQKLVALKHQLTPQDSLYDVKLKTIENSIYGVDIQPMATELSRLRCWLSLIVDEDPKDIKPLPNLDFKFVTANSLIDLGYDEFIHKVETGKAKGLFLHEFKNKLNNLRSVRQRYFDPLIGQKEKDRLKKEVNAVKAELYNMSLELIKQKILDAEFAYKINSWEPFDDSKSAPFFNKSWMFGVEDGFDVVIANPPYIRIQEIQKNNPQLAIKLKESFISASGSFDIYACFVELAVRLINSNGNISYILPHKFFQAAFGKNLRQLLSSKKMLRKIVDFGSSQVFESATTYTCLLFLSMQNERFKFAELKSDAKPNDLNQVFDSINSSDSLQNDKVGVVRISNDTVTEKEWQFSAGNSNDILSKLKKQPRTLADVCKKIFQGIATSADKIYFLEHISERDGIITAFSKSLDKEIVIERDFVKPLLKGADIHRYSTPEPKIWCIVPYWIKDNKAILYTQDEIKKRFPMAWEYLLGNRKGLEDRERGRMAHEQFYAYIYPKNLTEFEQAKIVTPEISYGCNLTYDLKGLYHNTKCYSFIFKKSVKEAPLFYLTLLNSKLLWFFLTSTGYVLRGGYFVFKTNYLMPFPIPKELSVVEQQPFITLVNQILSAKKKDPDTDTSALERQIDEMVYKLYDLTQEEIAIVEGT